MATLSFKTEFPWGESSYFVPKIWKGLIENFAMYNEYMSYLATVMESKNEKLMEVFIPVKDINTIVPKIHTIREDKKDLWKPGRKIHMVIFNRTKNRFQFAPVLECKSIQRIKIERFERFVFHPAMIRIEIDGTYFYNSWISSSKRGEIFAKNDGFNSIDDFARYFNKSFSGKIIHWTDLLY